MTLKWVLFVETLGNWKITTKQYGKFEQVTVGIPPPAVCLQKQLEILARFTRKPFDYSVIYLFYLLHFSHPNY